MTFKLYKGDKECICDERQVRLMKKAGWSTIKDAKPANQKVERDVVEKKSADEKVVAEKAKIPKSPITGTGTGNK